MEIKQTNKIERKSINWVELAEDLTDLLQYENNITPTEEGVIGEIEFIYGINGLGDLWSLELEILYRYISNGGNFDNIPLKDIEDLYKDKYDDDIKEVLK